MLIRFLFAIKKMSINFYYWSFLPIFLIPKHHNKISIKGKVLNIGLVSGFNHIILVI